MELHGAIEKLQSRNAVQRPAAVIDRPTILWLRNRSPVSTCYLARQKKRKLGFAIPNRVAVERLARFTEASVAQKDLQVSSAGFIRKTLR